MIINPNFYLHFGCKSEQDIKKKLDELWNCHKQYNLLRDMCKTLKTTGPLTQHLGDRK